MPHPSRFTPILLAPMLLVLGLLLTGCRGEARRNPDAAAATGVDTNDTLPGYLQEQDEAAAAVILIAWHGSEPPVPGVTRSREEARELALRLGVLVQEQMTFADAARRYSDDPATRERGGYVGIIHKGSWILPLEIALFDLPVGGVRAAVETPRGFFVLKRLPVMRVTAHHILIAWRGAPGAGASVTRTEEQARMMAEEVRRLCAAGETDLCDLAARYSDDNDSRFRCGLIGTVEPYALNRKVATALFRLRPGEVSAPVRTRFGYHILWIDP